MKKILLLTIVGFCVGMFSAATSYVDLLRSEQVSSAFMIGYLGGRILVWTLIGAGLGAIAALGTRLRARVAARGSRRSAATD